MPEIEQALTISDSPSLEAEVVIEPSVGEAAPQEQPQALNAEPDNITDPTVDDRGPVPYDRFAEVNTKYREVETKHRDAEAKLQELAPLEGFADIVAWGRERGIKTGAELVQALEQHGRDVEAKAEADAEAKYLAQLEAAYPLDSREVLEENAKYKTLMERQARQEYKDTFTRISQLPQYDTEFEAAVVAYATDMNEAGRPMTAGQILQYATRLNDMTEKRIEAFKAKNTHEVDSKVSTVIAEQASRAASIPPEMGGGAVPPSVSAPGRFHIPSLSEVTEYLSRNNR